MRLIDDPSGKAMTMATATRDMSAKKQHLLAQAALSTQLSQAMWDLIVERWNSLHPNERHLRRAECARIGHDRVMCPLGVQFCRRCCGYFEEE
jgi:hypothetical protein